MLLENLSAYPGGPLDDYWYGSVGKTTTAGVNVDESTALNYSACWAATRLIASAGATISLDLYQRSPNGGKSIATTHPVQKIIHRAFNPMVSSCLGRACGFNQQVNWGNFIAEIDRDGRGRPLGLYPIHASRVQYYYRRDGSFYYHIVNRDGTSTDLDPPDVFHVPSMMSDDGIVGKGVIRHARESIGLAQATERYGAGWFGSGGRPSAILKHPAKMEKTARDNLRREWQEIYGGPGTTHKVAVLWENMDYKAIGSSPEDSQFLESRQFSIEEIARWYGVPLHLLQSLRVAASANLETLGTEFVRYNLLPWLIPWEVEIGRKLLMPGEQNELFGWFNCDSLMRGDLTSRTAAYAQQFFNGALTINQWMEIENRDPIGDDGNVHFLQSAMLPLSVVAHAKPDPDAPPESGGARSSEKKESPAKMSADVGLQAATREVVADIIGRMVEIESETARRAANKPNEFLSWIDAFYETHSARMEKALAAPIRVSLLSSGRIDMPAEVTRNIVASHIAASREYLLNAAGARADELANQVSACVAVWDRDEAIEMLYADDQPRDDNGQWSGGGSHSEHVAAAKEAGVKAQKADQQSRPQGQSASAEQHEQAAKDHRTAQQAHTEAANKWMQAHASAPESEKIGPGGSSQHSANASTHEYQAKQSKKMAVFHEKMAKELRRIEKTTKKGAA